MKFKRKLKNKKRAIGSTGIPTKVLKVFDKSISIPLEKLINLFFKCGIFPMPLKVASVTPIHKKSDYLDCNNYHSLLLIPNLSKPLKNLTSS